MTRISTMPALAAPHALHELHGVGELQLGHLDEREVADGAVRAVQEEEILALQEEELQENQEDLSREVPVDLVEEVLIG